MTLQNLTLEANAAASARVVVLGGGANFNIITGCKIISNPLARTSTLSAGIYDNSGLDEYNIITYNEIENGYYGIYVYGSSTAVLQAGNIVENNTLTGFYYYGIYGYYLQAPKINHNFLENHTSSGWTYGLSCSYCQNEQEIIGNRVHLFGTSTQYGLRVYYCTATDSTMGLVANNMISITGSGTSTNYGLYWYYSNYQNYYYNSVNIAAGASGSYGAYIYQGANSNSMNNLFCNNVGGYSAYVSGTPIFITDYNNYFTTGSTLAYWGTSVADLLALQTANGQDLNSANVDPAFFLPNALYPGSVALDNLGTPVALISDDIDGNVRSLTTPDIGCVEFTPPQDDAGIVSIDSPTNPQAPGLHTISASLKNFGLVNLNTCNLNFSVNGGPAFSTLWVGSLAPGSVDGPNTIGTYNFPYGTHTIKVWTSNPNLQQDGNAINDTMVMTLNVCDILNGTYTIGDTSLGADYPSFNAALGDMLNCGVSGNVTFNVATGTYNEQITLTEIPGASLSNRITFQSATGNASDVILTHNASSTNNWTVKFDGADYFSLQNMTIKADDSTYARVIEITNGAHYNTIDGCVIISQPAARSNSYSAGIYEGSNSNDNFNIFANNEIWNGYYGIYSYGNGSSSLQEGTIIDNNLVQDYYYYGIYLYYHLAPKVNGNEIYNHSSSGFVYGLSCAYCQEDMEMQKNKVIASGTSTQYAFRVYYCTGTAQAMGLVANNMVSVNTPGNTSTNYGAYWYYSNFQRYFHNTIHMVGGSTSARPLYLYYGANSHNVNNVFTNASNGYAIYAYGTPVVVSDFNNYYTAGTTLGYWGTMTANLAAMQAASGMDSNSVSVSAQYASPTVLVPGSFSLNDLGTPLPDVMDDYFGNVRSTTTPDMGCVEFTPAQVDAALLSWDLPMGSACGLSQNEIIKVSVQNTGVTAITNVSVAYSINGGTTYSTPEIISGPIAPGDTVQHTFNQTADMSVYGTYSCVAAVSLTGDGNPLNDSVFVSITNIQPADSFPYVQDFETFIPGAPGTLADNWETSPNSGFRWQVNTGGTTSTLTGPLGDHTTGSGVYMYTEASTGAQGDIATLTTKCLDLSSLTAPELRFWYHMYGQDINKLAIEVLETGVWTEVFSLLGPQHPAQADPWLEAVVPLVNYSGAEKIRFKVTRGPSFDGDVSIDDVKIQEAPQFEAELMEFTGPFSGCDLSNETVSIKVTNRGAVSIQGILQASYHVAGAAAAVTEIIPDTLAPGDTLEYFFTTPLNLLVTGDSTFHLTGYIDLANDPDPSNDTAYWQVSSRVSSPAPIATHVTIPYGTSATLVAGSTGANQVFLWYDSLHSAQHLHAGDTFVTPPLYMNTVYWIEAEWGFPISSQIIGPGTATSTYVPCYGWYDYSWSASIYEAAELGFSGQIDTLAFYVNNTTSNYMMVNQLVFLGTTSDNEFFNTNMLDTTQLDLVFSGSVTWNAGWNYIPLSSSFNYNGSDNLILYWENWDGSYTSGYPSFSSTPVTGNKCKYNYADGAMPGSGSYYANRADIAFFGNMISGGNGCPSARVADSVYVIQPTVLVNAGNDTSICLGDSLQMNLTATGGVTPYTYSWSPAGSLNNANIANPVASPITNTTYSVTVTDQNGDTGTDDIIVLVNPGPNVNLANIPDICIDYAPYALTEGTPAGGVYSGPGVTAGVFNPAVAGAGTHTITYSYTDPLTGCSGSATNTVFVDLCIGLEDLSNGLGLSVYPNPSSGLVLVTLFSEEADVTLSIIDVTGKLILEKNLLNTRGLMQESLDLNHLAQGVYYLRLQGEEHSKAVKLILHE